MVIKVRTGVHLFTQKHCTAPLRHTQAATTQAWAPLRKVRVTLPSCKGDRLRDPPVDGFRLQPKVRSSFWVTHNAGAQSICYSMLFLTYT